MTLYTLREAPTAELARALADFETQFTYPLGPGRTFRISHGDDYPRFFRAIGTATSFVAADNGRVLGTLGVAVRRLLLPDGREQRVVYLGDLKVSPAARKSLVFLQLAWAAEAWTRPQATIGFGVVMDGTSATPDSYTGRVGIPAGRVLGKLQIWRLPADGALRPEDAAFRSTPEQVDACFRRLSLGRYASIAGRPEERSEMSLVALVHPSGHACGLLEDTRRAKRLWADDGSELRSAHLSSFAFDRPADAAELLASACRFAAAAEHPALFAGVADVDHPALDAVLAPPGRVLAPATVYGHGLDDGPAWNINTAEI